ncbi:MAG TPA: hypothetical protein VI759_02125 [Dehalococcoidia bacterium]|nr:hypothetical protein [Dehalococcoidia bacterium]
MNSAITTTGTRTWKLVKTRYLAAALGVALAISAVFGLDGARSVDFGGSSGQATAPAVLTLHAPAAEPATMYVVSSQAQADQIIANESEVGSARQIGVLVVDTAEKESQLQTGMNEMARAGSDTRLIDLRGR